MPVRAVGITGKQFARWLADSGLSNRAAAIALGVSENSIPKFIKNGAGRTVSLACTALACELDAWPLEGTNTCTALAALRKALREELKGLTAAKGQ